MMIDTPDDIPHSSVKTNSPPNPLDSREAAEKAAEDASREKFLEAFAEYTRAAKNHSWFVGWRHGFSSGWDAAKEHFMAQVEKQHTAIPPVPPPPPQTNKTPQGLMPIQKPGSPPAVVLVFRFIAANPGQRGVEIAQSLEGQLPERTVRTALHRLKTAERIQIVDGLWYVAQAAAANPKPREKDDGLP